MQLGMNISYICKSCDNSACYAFYLEYHHHAVLPDVSFYGPFYRNEIRLVNLNHLPLLSRTKSKHQLLHLLIRLDVGELQGWSQLVVYWRSYLIMQYQVDSIRKSKLVHSFTLAILVFCIIILIAIIS